MKLVNKICSLSALLVAGLIFTSCGNSTQWIKRMQKWLRISLQARKN